MKAFILFWNRTESCSGMRGLVVLKNVKQHPGLFIDSQYLEETPDAAAGPRIHGDPGVFGLLGEGDWRACVDAS